MAAEPEGRRPRGGSRRVWLVALLVVLVFSGGAAALASSFGPSLSASVSHTRFSRSSPWPRHVRGPLGQKDLRAIMAAGARARAQQARRLQARQRPGRVRERRRSRFAFERLSGRQAQALIARVFDLHASRWSSLTSARNGRVVRALGRNAAVVREGKHNVLLRSTSPVAIPAGRARPFALALDMHQSVAGFAPSHPAVPFTAPTDLASGIQIPGMFSVRPAEHRSSGSPRVIGDRVFYANSGTDTDFAVQPQPQGFEALWYLRSARSSLRQSLDFELPAGMVLRASSRLRGAVEIDRGRSRLGMVAPPTIHDADGVSVQGAYEVQGSRLTVRINPGQDVRYPLEVDPTVALYAIFGQFGPLNYDGQPATGWTVGPGAWLPGAYPSNPSPGFTYYSPYQNYPGLAVVGQYVPAGYLGYWYISANPNGAFSANQLGGQFSGFIARVDLNGVGSSGAGYSAQYENTDFFAEYYPHNSAGTAAAATNGNNPSTFSNMFQYGGGDYYTNNSPMGNFNGGRLAACAARDFSNTSAFQCDYTHASPNLFAFGIGTYNQGGGWPYAGIQGAAVGIADPAPPTQVTLGNIPSGWVQAGPTNATVAAQQPGLGIGSFSITDSGAQAAAWTDPCMNLPLDNNGADTNYGGGQLCPESSSHSFDLSGLPEGVHQLQGHAQSLLMLDGASDQGTLNVDHTPPSVQVSGPAYDSRLQQTASGNLTLNVNATDSDASHATSGTTSIQTLVDGQATASGPNASQPCSSGGCNLSASGNVNYDSLSPGAHTVEIRATDAAGNVGEEDFVVVTGSPDQIYRQIDDCWTGGTAPTMASPQMIDLGATFDSLPLSDASLDCNPNPSAVAAAGTDAVPNTVPYASLSYGDCQLDPNEPEHAGCAPPLTIQYWPQCARNEGSYFVPAPDGSDQAMENTDVALDQLPGPLFSQVQQALTQESSLLPAINADLSGLALLPAASYEGGTRVEIYSGTTTIVIFANDPALANLATSAVALRLLANGLKMDPYTANPRALGSGCFS